MVSNVSLFPSSFSIHQAHLFMAVANVLKLMSSNPSWRSADRGTETKVLFGSVRAISSTRGANSLRPQLRGIAWKAATILNNSLDLS